MRLRLGQQHNKHRDMKRSCRVYLEQKDGKGCTPVPGACLSSILQHLQEQHSHRRTTLDDDTNMDVPG